MSNEYLPLDGDWMLLSPDPKHAPESLRHRLQAGIPAKVPGEATVDLLRNELIADPFDSDNENTQLWIGRTDWRFERHFEWHDDGRTMHELVAFGLDTIATVSLNGHVVDRTRNCYRSYRWNVNEILHEGDNVLTVDFTAPIDEADRLEHRRGYYPHAERWPFNQIRKTPYSFGWDWGVAVPGAGIWQSIGIESWSGVRIAQVRPLTSLEANGMGELNLYVRIVREDKGRVIDMSSPHDAETTVHVAVALTGNDNESALNGEIICPPGHNEGHLQLQVPKARQWWPVGYGTAELYDLNLRVSTAGANTDDEDQQDDGTTDMWHRRIGFRTISIDTATDKYGHPFRFIVNGRPIHARGFNWIPDNAFISQVTAKDYQRGIRDLLESNSNMLRVWGGGIYESDILYDLADEHGILIWQDFTFACAMYPEDTDLKAEAEAEAREQIARLSSHPSLALWNGSNENWTAYANWEGYAQGIRDDDAKPNRFGYGERGWGDYYYSTLFPNLLAELDPTRPYLPSSPMSFGDYVDQGKDTDGTMHIWDVWNSADYRKYADYRPRFADEFGYQGPPAFSTLAGVVHDRPMTPFGKDMVAHQKAMLGNEKLTRGMRSHLTPGAFMDYSLRDDGSVDWCIPTDQWDDIEDWHWAAQLQQAHAVRFGVEHMRSLEPLNAGALIWQLNDDWPVISWAAVDFEGHRKPLWHVARQAFAPCLAIIAPGSSPLAQASTWPGALPRKDILELVLVNDSMVDWSGSWVIRRMGLDGTTSAQHVIHAAVAAGQTARFAIPDGLAGFDDPSKEILVAETDHDFARVIFNPAEVMDQHLVAHPLKASVVDDGEQGYALTVHADAYARDVFVMADKVEKTAEADQGMVSLLPGETVAIHIRSGKVEDPSQFTDSNVLRCANDICRNAI